MTPEQRHKADTITDTGQRHNLMYKISANNPDKGKPGGDCNVTQCQRPGASCYNTPMRAFYCVACATDINKFNKDPFVDIKPDYSIAYGTDDPLDRELDLPTDQLDSEGNFIYSKNYVAEKPNSKKNKVGRNELCPCGSLIKYKKCCL